MSPVEAVTYRLRIAGPTVRFGLHCLPMEGGSVAGFGDPQVTWRKSSSSQSSDCAEVAVANGSVLVRDSANRDGVVLRFPPAAWSAFVARTRALRDERAG